MFFAVIFVVLLLVVEVYAVAKNSWNNPIKPLDLNKFSNKVIFLCFKIITLVFAYFGDTAFIYAQF